MKPTTKRTRKTRAAAQASTAMTPPGAEAAPVVGAGVPMEPPAEEITPRQARVLAMQGQWLIRQAQALCNRLAGEKMAAGFVDAQGAAIMVQQELAKIEAGLREIDASVPQEG